MTDPQSGFTKIIIMLGMLCNSHPITVTEVERNGEMERKPETLEKRQTF